MSHTATYNKHKLNKTNGNITATPCLVRGQKRWRIETGTGWKAGQRKRQIFKTEAEALQAARDAAKERAQLGKAWHIMGAAQKVGVMATLTEIHEAGMTLDQVWSIARNQPDAPKSNCTLQKAVDETIAAKRQAGCRSKHLKNLEWYLGRFIKGRERTQIAKIGEPEISDWFAKRKEAPRSKKQHMGLLSALFQHAWRRRYIAENPVDRMDKVRVDQGIPQTLTLRQCWQAVTWCRRQKPEFLAWLALTLFVGMRPEAEADHITWDDIDLKRSRIVITKSKTRKPRIIDLSFCPPALAWLEIAKEQKSPLPIAKITRRRYIRKLRDRLKLKAWPQDVLRHTAASNLLAFHQDAGKVASFLGNSAGVLLRSYKALVFKEDAEKWMSLKPRRRHHP